MGQLVILFMFAGMPALMALYVFSQSKKARAEQEAAKRPSRPAPEAGAHEAG